MQKENSGTAKRLSKSLHPPRATIKKMTKTLNVSKTFTLTFFSNFSSFIASLNFSDFGPELWQLLDPYFDSEVENQWTKRLNDTANALLIEEAPKQMRKKNTKF